MNTSTANTNNETESEASLINKALIKAWLGWSLVWLTLFPLVGLLVSIKFHIPGFLDSEPWLTFGRLRPVHVNGVIFGAFSTPFIGLLYYMVPRLCGIRMYKEHWGWWLLHLWNGFLVLGTISLMMGYNLGFEAAEYEWFINILRFIALAFITVQVVGTVFNRVEKRVYVSLWYGSAALVWTLLNLILGNIILPYGSIFGVNSAALHGLFIHYVVGLWLTPAGLAMIYYFLPLSVKNPLYSHRISLLGFWSLAFFYPFVGTHHYLMSPIPYWTQTISIVTSMLLIIPVWAVTVNFLGTAMGRWGAMAGGKDSASYTAKFCLLGAVYYLLGCFQGSTEALRRMQELTHFNDFVISHAHFTVFGAMVVWIIAGMYYVWPRVVGRELWSYKLASWHFWLTVSGASLMFIGLTAQGFIQGSMLEFGANFVDSVREMKPWWVARTLAGATMDIGLLLMLINFIKTARSGEQLSAEAAASPPSPVHPDVKVAWYEKPQAIMITAGVAFFFLAVYSQGVAPLLSPKTHVKTVDEAVTDNAIKVADYTPMEQRGRQVYIREGCWYCHSQYVRPMTDEKFRWGPMSQLGEYAHDEPHLFGTRRTGPDLHRVGLKYSDGWHAAHHWNPRSTVPASIMPRFPWLFKEQTKDGQTPQMTKDGKALVAYLQRLGTEIGDWREGFASTQMSSGVQLHVGPQSRERLVEAGEQVYEQRCVGCHGKKGDGNGPAAKFMDVKPRDFTSGIFKFRSTPGKDSLPTDKDLYKTITHGLWGTAMPGWYKISERERLAVIQYIKTFSDRWDKEEVKPPIAVPSEPPITQNSLKQGKALFEQRCAVCHGEQGKGDGPIANTLTDTWGDSVTPANFTLPAGEGGGVKLGHDSRHIFQTIMTGVGGTPMPVFQGTLAPAQVWDIVHYVQSLRIDAYENTLLEAGMDKDKLPEARSKLWAELSTAAQRGQIDKAVVEAGQQQRHKLAQTVDQAEDAQ